MAKWSSYELPVCVQKGDTVRWEFTTKNNADISFGVNFIPGAVPAAAAAAGVAPAVATAASATAAKQEVQANKRVNSHLETIRGQYVAAADGVVELKWDNTYSYMTNKQLLYKAELVPVVDPAVAAAAAGVAASSISSPPASPQPTPKNTA